jgi:hypothetical protein
VTTSLGNKARNPAVALHTKQQTAFRLHCSNRRNEQHSLPMIRDPTNCFRFDSFILLLLRQVLAKMWRVQTNQLLLSNHQQASKVEETCRACGLVG